MNLLKFALFTSCAAISAPAFAQECENANNGQISVYHTQLNGNAGNNWKTNGIAWGGNLGNCKQTASINIENKNRFGLSDTNFGGTFGFGIDDTRRIKFGVEFAPNAVFSANKGFELGYSQKVMGFEKNQSSVIAKIRGGVKNYENTNASLIGIGAEFYPSNSNSWFAFEIAQNFAFDTNLPLAYSAQANVEITPKMAFFVNGGHYYENYSTTQIAINEYGIGLEYSVKENLKFKAFATGIKQENMNALNGFGVSLGLRL